MTIDWTIDAVRGVVRMTYHGIPDFAIWAATMRAIFAHPAYRSGFGFVAELDGAEPPDTAHLVLVMRFVAEHSAELTNTRWANVTVNPAHYGMTRVVQARSQDLPGTVEVFRTVAEAITWVSPMSPGEL